MRFLQRTRVYGWNEFCGLEARKEMERVDKKLGMLRRIDKKVYKSIIVIIACLLYSGTITVIPGNAAVYEFSHELIKYGTFISILIDGIIDMFFAKKNSFLKEFSIDYINILSIGTILMTFAKYICSSFLI